MAGVSNFVAVDAAAAGILFVNKWPRPTHCLAGFQSKRGGITGFGGKAEPGDYGPIHTACRETLEELLGISNTTLAAYMSWEIEPVKEFETDDGAYKTFVMTFGQLERVLRGLWRAQEESPFYDMFPMRVIDCVLERRVVPGMEVGGLSVLPICRSVGANELVLKELLDDWKKL
jgi:8-oxo-dGTP pyrophosphatase MutT (NUDIX family)